MKIYRKMSRKINCKALRAVSVVGTMGLGRKWDRSGEKVKQRQSYICTHCRSAIGYTYWNKWKIMLNNSILANNTLNIRWCLKVDFQIHHSFLQQICAEYWRHKGKISCHKACPQRTQDPTWETDKTHSNTGLQTVLTVMRESKNY